MQNYELQTAGANSHLNNRNGTSESPGTFISGDDHEHALWTWTRHTDKNKTAAKRHIPQGEAETKQTFVNDPFF